MAAYVVSGQPPALPLEVIGHGQLLARGHGRIDPQERQA